MLSSISSSSTPPSTPAAIYVLVGNQGAGKDTVAAHLVDIYGVKRLAFASILKDVCAALFQWPRDWLEGREQVDREWREQVDTWWAAELCMPDFTPRRALELVGTDVFRLHFHPRIWVLAMKRAIQRAIAAGHSVVISDCRFQNEADFLREFAANNNAIPLSFWRIERPVAAATGGGGTTHVSNMEHAQIQCDCTFSNTGTIADLCAQVDAAMRKG